jgi:xanthine dehydrogenase accessory factor
LATIIETKGSVPRNENVSMVVSSSEQYGTIGGGELEYQVIKESNDLLNNLNCNQKIIELPLGPALGQCCGGFVKIQLSKFNNGIKLLLKHDLKEQIINQNQNLYIFGAGHVAKALLSKLDGVGFNIFIIDSRENFISKINADFVFPILAKDHTIVIKNSPSKSFYLVLTHSHQLDLSICDSLLKKNDFTFIGLIGSKTKKIRFKKKLIEIGHDENSIDKIECPIGIQSIKGKEPDVIAISIIARLLEYKSSSAKIEKKYIRLVKS